MSTLDKLYLGTQIRIGKIKENVKDFIESEKGISNIVATILLLLIVMLVIGLFFGELQEWLETTMDKVFSEDNLPTLEQEP